MMKPALFTTLLVLTLALPAWACRGIESERAQERDASVLFEGRPVAYELDASVHLAKVTFNVTKPIRGETRKQWTAIMRGSGLPKSLREFTTRFSSHLKVGLRDLKEPAGQPALPADFRNLLFVVDAACSMNGEDWLLRPIPGK
jgi:hypothetical protein